MENVKIHQPVDYAYPKLQAEKAIKQTHELILDNKFNEAADKALEAMAELKLFRTAILTHTNQ